MSRYKLRAGINNAYRQSLFSSYLNNLNQSEEMKTFVVTYNHIVYKPSDYTLFKKQQAFSLEIEAVDIEAAKEILKKEHNKNPFYFYFNEVK